MAALDETNRRLIERQRHMFESPGGFGEKWAKSLEFYKDDLASGFVRVQMELWAACLSNQELRNEFLPRVLAWFRIVTEAVKAAVVHYDVELPFSSEALAGWICSFWVGVEFAGLVGIPEDEGHFEVAFAAMQQLLDGLDGKSSRDAPSEPPQP